MSTEERDYFADRSPAETAQELASGLAEQKLRVRALTGDGLADGPELSSVLGEMDIAHEELRVAEEELRLQQQRLDALLAERHDPRAWRRHLIGTLPVPAVVTEADGTVVELNAAAWSMLRLRRDEIIDRPLTRLVAPDDRDRLRQVLQALGGDSGSHQVTVRWHDPDSPDSSVGADGCAGTSRSAVELVARTDAPGTPGSTITWVVSNGSHTGQDRENGLRTAEAFAEMCRLPLQSGADTRTVLARAALLVEKAVPASDGVSITLGSPAAPETQATDNVWAQSIDGAQLQAAEGPCLTAYLTGAVQVCEDLGHDERWPNLAALALPLGVRAVLACPIRTDRHSLGVLNVYASSDDAFDDRDRQVADLLVSAVLAVVQESRDRRELTELSDQLRQALESRGVIDQAKGILMNRHGVGADAAFAQLVGVSRRSNVKVRDVARAVVETSGGDTRPPGSGADAGG